MSFLKNIFSMKTYAVVYSLIVFALCLIGSANQESLGNSEYTVFIEISSAILLLLGIIITYAVGWKKKLFSNGCVVCTIVFSIVFTCLGATQIGINTYLNEEFPITLAMITAVFSFIISLLLYLPAFIASIVYLLKSKEYETVEKPVCKVLFSIFAYNLAFTIVSILYNVMVFENAFDYLDIICGFFITVIGILYAWNIKFRNKTAVQIISLICAIEMCLPAKMFSYQYAEFADIEIYSTYLVGFLTYLLLAIFVIITMYRYAFTNEIYKPVEKTELQSLEQCE